MGFICLDIFEPSTQQKLDFIDIQENDAISEASDDEIVAHSTAGQTYEHTAPVDSEDSEDQSRLPPVDTQIDTYGIDVDLDMNNGLADDSEEYDDGLLMDNKGTLSDNIETSLANVVIEENGKRKNEQVEAEKMETEVKHSEVLKVKSENKEVENMKKEKQQEGQKVDEEIRNEEKEGSQVEDEKSEESEERVEIVVEDDYSDDTTEVDKLLGENHTKVDQQRPKRKMVSSGTQSHEVQPLLNTSQSPSPEPLESPGHRKQFTPREYPGKAVKSIAIGTDDDYPPEQYSKKRQPKASPGAYKKRDNAASTRKTPPQPNIENGVKTFKKASTPSSTRTSTPGRSNRQTNGDTSSNRSNKQVQGERGSLSSDALFFKSRLPQTSRRRPKRHVWLVRDSEIHRLIAEKASILRRFKDEGVTGKQI